MTFTYNRDIPDGPNNPSRDQPLMKTNTNSIDDLIAVNHISFRSAGGGQHTLINFNATPNFVVVPPNPTLNDSIIYTNPGNASSKAEVFFVNSEATLLVSSIKAFGVFAGANSNPITLLNGYNIVGINRNSIGSYTVTINPNIVTTAEYGVLVSATLNAVSTSTILISNYTINSATTFTLTFNAIAGTPGLKDPARCTFQVFQY